MSAIDAGAGGLLAGSVFVESSTAINKPARKSPSDSGSRNADREHAESHGESYRQAGHWIFRAIVSAFFDNPRGNITAAA